MTFPFYIFEQGMDYMDTILLTVKQLGTADSLLKKTMLVQHSHSFWTGCLLQVTDCIAIVFAIIHDLSPPFISHLYIFEQEGLTKGKQCGYGYY